MFYMRRPEAEDIQLDLILSYANKRRPLSGLPSLLPRLATAAARHCGAATTRSSYRRVPRHSARDLPKAEIHLLDTGHFALETHHAEIAALMRDFLQRHGA